MLENKLTALTVLRAGHWFRGLDDELLTEIADLSVLRRYRAGEVVFVREQPGRYLYGIISGSIRVTTESLDGRELALSIMGPGDIGGEIAALDGGLRTATWTTLSETTVFVVSRENLNKLMLRRPQIALHMIEVLCERVRRTSQQVEDTAFLTLAERLAGQLRVLVENSGAEIPCALKISQKELASFLNVSRQVVNGALQEWQKLGWLELKRGTIEVRDLEAIHQHAKAD